MKDSSFPQKLYHYTSLANLALILQAQKIRCRRLDLVDDLTEGRPADFPNLAQYIFVSCWTDSNEESIPLWHMYSAGMHGVRISLPSRFLCEHEYHSEPAKDIYVEPGYKSVVAQEDFHGPDYLFWLTPGKYPLYRIQYTDDPAELFPSIVDQTDRGTTLAIDKVGAFKRREWQFQHEWRIKLVAFPAAAPGGSHADPEYQQQMTPLPRILNQQMVSIYHYDLDIEPSALLKMKVTLGPKFHAGERLLLESYLKQNELWSGVTVEESTLSGTIR